MLEKVAAVMKKAMKGRGFVARWGGEEFLIIQLLEKDQKGRAIVRLEEIREEVEKQAIEMFDMLLE